MPWANPEDRRAYQREYMRENRKWLKEHHFCVQCQKQDAYTLSGRSNCAECCEKRRNRDAKKKKNGVCVKCGKVSENGNAVCESCAIKSKEKRQEKKKNHLCQNCGKSDEETRNGKIYCKICADKKKRKSKEKRLETSKHPGIPKIDWYKHGWCAICGENKIDNEDVKLCESCYKNALIGYWYGRKSQGPRKIEKPMYDTQNAREAYQYCLDHREEWLEKWHKEYDSETPPEKIFRRLEGLI